MVKLNSADTIEMAEKSEKAHVCVVVPHYNLVIIPCNTNNVLEEYEKAVYMGSAFNGRQNINSNFVSVQC